MIKVVLDTNIIISGLNFPKGKPAQILELLAYGVIRNFISESILEETAKILGEKFFWEKEKTKSAKLLNIFSKNIKPKNRLHIIPHQADNRIIECAVAGKVDFIISGDKHLLGIGVYRNIKIVTPDELLKRVLGQ